MKRIFFLALGALLAVTLLAGCQGNTAGGDNANDVNTNTSGATEDTSIDDIKAKGELVIGLDATFAPMGFKDESGTLQGLDIDLATAVCEKLGVKPVFQPISWDAKEMELETKRIDCIWNGMSITEERKAAMELSNPYLNNKIIVMTNKGVEVKSKEDLKNYNVATQAKSSALEVIEADPEYATFKDKVTQYPTYDEIILDMKAGRIDVMIVDEVLGKYKNSKLGDDAFEIAPFDFGDDLYAVGFRKGDVKLCEAVNAALVEVIDSGKGAEISNKWFGENLLIKG